MTRPREPVAVFGDERLPSRFWDKVVPEPNSGCWLWTSCVCPGGYARFSHNGRNARAHRVAYEALSVPLTDGMCLDHLCRTRCCVNPTHLEEVTFSVNNLRGTGFSGRNARVRTCSNGHPFTTENTYTGPLDDRRACRTCRMAQNRRQKQLQKERRALRRLEKQSILIDSITSHPSTKSLTSHALRELIARPLSRQNVETLLCVPDRWSSSSEIGSFTPLTNVKHSTLLRRLDVLVRMCLIEKSGTVRDPKWRRIC